MRISLMSDQKPSVPPNPIQTGALADIIILKDGQTRVSCDGNGGVLGHPQIWLNAETQPDGSESVTCPYCSRIFVRSKIA